MSGCLERRMTGTRASGPARRACYEIATEASTRAPSGVAHDAVTTPERSDFDGRRGVAGSPSDPAFMDRNGENTFHGTDFSPTVPLWKEVVFRSNYPTQTANMGSPLTIDVNRPEAIDAHDRGEQRPALMFGENRK